MDSRDILLEGDSAVNDGTTHLTKMFDKDGLMARDGYSDQSDKVRYVRERERESNA